MGRAASNEWIDSLSPSGCSPGSGSHRTAETDISSPLGQPRGCRASKEATHGEEVKGAFQEMPREGKEKEKEGEGQQQGSGEGSRVWKPVLFAGEREDPEEKERSHLMGVLAEPAFCDAVFGVQLIQRRCVVGGRERCV